MNTLTAHPLNIYASTTNLDSVPDRALQEAQEWGSAAVLIAAIVVGVLVFLGTKNEYAAIWIVVKLPQEYWIHVAQLELLALAAEDLDLRACDAIDASHLRLDLAGQLHGRRVGVTRTRAATGRC